MRILLFQILNTDLSLAGFLDNASSVIYAPEFRNKGSFTIKALATTENIALLTIGRFIIREDDENFGIIKAVSATDNIIENYLTITCCFGNGILEQRVVFDKSDISDTRENTIRTLITNNIISATDTNRNIAGFALSTALGTTDSISGNYYGKNLLTAINELVKDTNYGFKVIIKRDVVTSYTPAHFEFSLIAGIDRTMSQSINNRVIFSDTWDNLLENEYTKSLELYKNVVLVLGEGEGAARLTTVVGTGAGISRYEGVVDASSISTDNGTMAVADYTSLLKQAGVSAMGLVTDSFIGNIRMTGTFIYRTDFKIGDIVTLYNSKLGVAVDIRITGMTETEDDAGYNIVPVLGVETASSDTTTTVSGEVLTKLFSKDVIDNLTSTDTNKPLSANQGKELNEKKSGKADNETIAGLKTFSNVGGVIVGGTTLKDATKTIKGVVINIFDISKKAFFEDGAVFKGTAAAAGLVTRGISGCDADGNQLSNLYLNYRGIESYASANWVYLGGTAAGYHAVAFNELLNAIYPVGSIYLSVLSTSPATLFGGTWVQLKDKFLLGAGDTYANGATGGAATHKLTVAEMPSHSHNTYMSAGGGSYTSPSGEYTGYYGPSGGGWINPNSATGGDAAHNNMPPYLTVYIWKRTA